jgi:HlyD family secretion protein
VTYNVAIEVSNPEEKLKPGMTTNLTFTIDERNNVLRVPNAALRFTPQDANTERTGNGQRQRAGGANGQDGQRSSRRSSQGQEAADAGGNAAEQNRAQSGGQRASTFAPPSAPVLPGQTRIVWVMGQDGKPERRRITVGLSDGSATEVVEGNLQEGDTVITGQNVTSAARTQSTQAAPGFGGGAPRVGGGGRR